MFMVACPGGRSVRTATQRNLAVHQWHAHRALQVIVMSTAYLVLRFHGQQCMSAALEMQRCLQLRSPAAPCMHRPPIMATAVASSSKLLNVGTLGLWHAPAGKWPQAHAAGQLRLCAVAPKAGAGSLESSSESKARQ